MNGGRESGETQNEQIWDYIFLGENYSNLDIYDSLSYLFSSISIL